MIYLYYTFENVLFVKIYEKIGIESRHLRTNFWKKTELGPREDFNLKMASQEYLGICKIRKATAQNVICPLRLIRPIIYGSSDPDIFWLPNHLACFRHHHRHRYLWLDSPWATARRMPRPRPRPRPFAFPSAPCWPAFLETPLKTPGIFSWKPVQGKGGLAWNSPPSNVGYYVVQIITVDDSISMHHAIPWHHSMVLC